MSLTQPLVLVTSCNRMMGEHPFHIVGKKYMDAVRLAGALPLMAPPLDDAELDQVLQQVDGVLLTGSPSNVHPSHYGETVHDPELPQDPARDAWTLHLVRKTLALGLPMLAICRGTQEVNVALGGSLHQAVQEQPGLNDHRSDPKRSAELQYGLAHPVDVVPGSVLAAIVKQPRIEVNSIHGQGVKQLAAGLRAEAFAPDGLIEAFSMPAASGFNLCVQWHPEWQATQQPVSVQIFEAFGLAVRAWQDQRLAKLALEAAAV